LEGIDESDLWVYTARRGQMRAVQSRTNHEKADLCVLKLASDPADDLGGYPTGAFWGSVGNLGLGEPFVAYGYPIEHGSVGPLVAAPSARLIVGNYQRFYEFGSPDGYQFLAGEMSVAATTGMSGGPLFRPGAAQMLSGLVVASVESSVEAYKKIVVTEGAETYIEKVDRITEYGVALILEPFKDWLAELIPTFPASA
jgi:hypothetical protein